MSHPAILEQHGCRFVSIPAGAFTLGSPPTEKGRGEEDVFQPVRLTRPFEIATVPVTRGLYRAVMRGREEASADASLPMVDTSWVDALGFCNRLSELAGLAPAYRLDPEMEARVRAGIPDWTDWDWNCTWDRECRGYRLPTEAEWEWAARAGQSTRYAGSDDLDAVAWHGGNSGGELRPVGGKRPNPWGLLDMSGLVYEWVWDREQPVPRPSESALVDPRGPDGAGPRIVKGGSYKYRPSGRVDCLRIAHRASRASSLGEDDLGFRLAI